LKCGKCGNTLPDNTKFCPMCGQNFEESILNKEIIQNDNNIKKNNKKTIMIILIIVIGAVLLFVGGLFTGKSLSCKDVVVCDGENNDISSTDDEITEYSFNLFDVSKIEKISNKDNELTKNITIDNIFFNPYGSMGKYQRAKIYGKNNNNIPVEVNVSIEFYDSEGYRIEKESDSLVVFANKDFVLDFYVLDDSLKYSTVKLFYEANNIKSYYTVINEEEIKISSDILSDKNINIVLENNSDLEIKTGEIACLYYKDDKLVFANNASVFSVGVGEKTSSKCYDSQLNLNNDYSNLKKIEYDDVKVVLYSAYHYTYWLLFIIEILLRKHHIDVFLICIIKHKYPWYNIYKVI